MDSVPSSTRVRTRASSAESAGLRVVELSASGVLKVFSDVYFGALEGSVLRARLAWFTLLNIYMPGPGNNALCFEVFPTFFSTLLFIGPGLTGLRCYAT